MSIRFALIPDTNPILLKPDMTTITKLSGGDVGISDSIKESSTLKTLLNTNDYDSIKIYLNNNKVEPPNSIESYKTSNGFKIPSSDIKFSPETKFEGLKALEITLIKSIFETQKPYMEIATIVTKNLVLVEDVIARVLAITDKSQKPKTNPKALGYQVGSFKSDLSKVKNLNNSQTQNKNKKDTNPFNVDYKKYDPTKNDVSVDYEIVKTEYSTGVKKDDFIYDYVYHDISTNNVVIDDTDTDIIDNINNPDIISFGIFYGSGISFDAPKWLSDSGKWYGQFPQVGGYSYVWKRNNDTLVSFGVPNADDYGTGWENTEEKVFNQNDIDYYKNYYNFVIDDKLSKRPNISEADKNDIRQKVRNKLDINAQLNGVSSDGFIFDFNPQLFTQSNASFMPKSINYNGKDIYIDPETDYELKVIKIDSSLDIQFNEEGKPIKTTIQRFVSNNYKLSYYDNSLFDISFDALDFKSSTTGLTSSTVNVNNLNFTNLVLLDTDNLEVGKDFKVDITRRTNPTDFTELYWETGKETSWSVTPNFSSTSTGVSGQTQSSSTSKEYNYIYKDAGVWKYGRTNTGLFIQNINYNDTSISTSVIDGVYDIPKFTNNIVVKDGVIYGWKSSVVKIIISDNKQVVSVINSDDTLSTNITEIQSGLIRVAGGTIFGKIITSNQITNDQLKVNVPYSSDVYGNTDIQQLYRYRTSLLDTQTYYIIEGKKPSDNNDINNAGAQNGSVSSNNEQWYHKPQALGATKSFINLFTNILVDLIPQITNLLGLIKNPAEFATKPIMDKLGESFSMFSKSIISDYKKLSDLPPNQRFDFVEQNFELKKYVDVDKTTGDFRHILDGRSIVELFSIRFGLELKGLDLKLIFDKASDLTSTFNNVQSTGNRGPSTPGKNLDNLGLPNNKEVVTTKNPNGDIITEEVSVVYSTGVKKSGVDYDYIYLTETVKVLYDEYNSLYKDGRYEDALDKLEIASKIDPNNKLINELLDSLKDKLKSITQPLLRVIIELVTTPIKIIKGIIDYIKSLFENIDLASLPNKFKDFITFKWILDFFKPEGILALAGIKFNPTLMSDWTKNYKNFPDNHMFDLSSIFSMPFFGKLPTVTKEVLPYMTKLLCPIFNSVFSLFEGIINSFIDLVWSLFGLAAITKAPHVKFGIPCSNSNIKSGDLLDILNATNNSLDSNSTLSQFIYDIKLPDGRNIRDLDRVELYDFLQDNKDLTFNFSF